MSLQQIFSIVLFIISLLGIHGSCSLQLFKDFHVGPGFFPLFYSAVLLILSVAFFLGGKKVGKANLKILFQKPAADGTVFFFIFSVSVLIMYLVDTYLALAFLTMAGLGFQKKMKWVGIIVFLLVFLGIIYIIFSIFLKIPLEQGILFK